MFGVGFVIRLLRQSKNQDLLLLVEPSLYSALVDPRTSYEDQVYLLQALWLLYGETDPPRRLVELTEQILQNVPVWPYLMVGTEGIPSVDDAQTTGSISHLYRSILLDVMLRFQHYTNVQANVILAAKYRGRHIVPICAFGFGVILVAIIWFFLVQVMASSYDAARRYWFFHEYRAMTAQSALLYMIYVLVALLLLLFSPVFIWTW